MLLKLFYELLVMVHWLYIVFLGICVSQRRSSLPKVFCKKDVLRNLAKFTGKHLCQGLFFSSCRPEARNFIEKRLAQGFSCEFCEISKNTFCHRTPPVTASVNVFMSWVLIPNDY